MNWLRSRAGYCAGFGLLAIALQFVVAFGHVHITDATGIRPANAQASTTSAFPAQALVAKAILKAQSLAPSETGDAQDNPSTELCPTCLAMALAHSVVLTPPPLLPAPSAFRIVARIPSAEIAAFANPRLSFWSRGPPLS